MRKNELDEMQVQKRNKIGNQAFMLLFYLLMIDIGLNGFGIRWLQYPNNVFVIMLACMTYYLIRIIWHSSFVGPQQSSKSITRKTVCLTGAAGVVAAFTAFISQKYFMKAPTSTGDVNGALILMVFSIVMIIIVAGVSVISKRQNKDDSNTL